MAAVTPSYTEASWSSSAQSNWYVTLPPYSTGDLILVHIANDNSTNVTSVTWPTGKDGETITKVVDGVGQHGTPPSERIYFGYYIATDDYAGGSGTSGLLFQANASENWAAVVARVDAGDFNATEPVGTYAVSGEASNQYQVVDGLTTSADESGDRLMFWMGVDGGVQWDYDAQMFPDWNPVNGNVDNVTEIFGWLGFIWFDTEASTTYSGYGFPADWDTVVLTGAANATSLMYVLRSNVPEPINAVSISPSNVVDTDRRWIANTTHPITLPAYNLGDLVIWHVSMDSTASPHTLTYPSGPDGETFTVVVNHQSGTTIYNLASVAYYIATDDYAGGTLNLVSSSWNELLAYVAIVPAGRFDTSTPIGTYATGGTVTTETDYLLPWPQITTSSTEEGDRLVLFAAIQDSFSYSGSSNFGTNWTEIQISGTGTPGGTIYTDGLLVQSENGTLASTTYNLDVVTLGSYERFTTIAYVLHSDPNFVPSDTTAAVSVAAAASTVTATGTPNPVIYGSAAINSAASTATGSGHAFGIMPSLVGKYGSSLTPSTPTSSWQVIFNTHPAGQLVVVVIAYNDSAGVTSITPPAGPNGETWIPLFGPTSYTSSATSTTNKSGLAIWYTVALGTISSSTPAINRTWTPNVAETYTYITFGIEAGTFDATYSPFGAKSGYHGRAISNPFGYGDAFLSGGLTAHATDEDGIVLAFFGKSDGYPGAAWTDPYSNWLYEGAYLNNSPSDIIVAMSSLKEMPCTSPKIKRQLLGGDVLPTEPASISEVGSNGDYVSFTTVVRSSTASGPSNSVYAGLESARSLVLPALTASAELDTYIPEVANLVNGSCTNSGNNTTSSSWGITLPAYSAGDLIIVHLAWDDSTTVAGHDLPNGPNGELPHPVILGNFTTTVHDQRGSVWYWVATDNYAGGTYTVTPTASEEWTATVVRVLQGSFDPALPIGRYSTGGSASAIAYSNTTGFTAGPDERGRLCAWFAIDTRALSTTAPSGWKLLANIDRGNVGGAFATRDVAVTPNEVISGTQFTLSSSDTSNNVMYVLRAFSSDLVGTTVHTTGTNDVTQYNHTTASFGNDWSLMYPLETTTDNYGTSTRWALDVPKSARITAVKLIYHEGQGTGYQNQGLGTIEVVGFEQVDNAPVLTSGSEHATAYANMGTTQSTDMGTVPALTRTYEQIGPFDLSATLLQEIVDRTHWSSENYVRVFTRTTGSDPTIAQWQAQNGTLSYVKPQLVVHYDARTIEIDCTSDGYVEGASTWTGDDVELYVGLTTGGGWEVKPVMRFTGVNLPANASVTGAWVQMGATWPGDGDRPEVVIAADTAATPTLPTSYSEWQNKTRTTAKVNWTADAATWTGVTNANAKWQSSADISSVIQELIATNGAYENGVIQIFYDEPAGGFTEGEMIAWRSVDTNQAAPFMVPRLVVSYTTALIATGSLLLPALTSAASGDISYPERFGSGTLTLPALTATASADFDFIIEGSAALDLPSLQAASEAAIQLLLLFVPNGDLQASNVAGSGANLWAQVDEGVDTSDGDASYVENDAVGDAFVRFDLTNPPGNLDEVTSIRVKLRAKKVT